MSYILLLIVLNFGMALVTLLMWPMDGIVAIIWALVVLFNLAGILWLGFIYEER